MALHPISDISQRQFETNEIVAGNRLLLWFRARALALNFAFCGFSPVAYRLGHGGAQIEVAAKTFAVRTNKGEERFRVPDIDLVAQGAASI